jgi:protein-tyrosine phosphatase
MIDLHSHILPGIDDGARTLDESLDMLAEAARSGVVAMAATPHVRRDYPTTPIQMERTLRAVRRAVAAEKIPITVLPGGEIDLDALDKLERAERSRFGLGGNPKYLLLEVPYRGWRLSLPLAVARLIAEGIRPVLAHPERNDEVQETPELLEPLVGAGALLQLTAGSVTGEHGSAARRTSFHLIESELAHLIGSDAHNPAFARAGVQAAAAALRDPELALWLTSAIPRAIVGDEPLPERPRRRQRRRVRLPRWLASADRPRRR